MILISRIHEGQLFDDLSKKPFVNIFDQQPAYEVDPDNVIIEVLEYKSLASFFFNTNNYQSELNFKFHKFQEEVNSNKLITGINLYKYHDEATSKFRSLESRFSLKEFYNKMYLWRTDVAFYYDASSHEESPIADLKFIPKQTIEEIASFFVFQNAILSDSIKILESLLSVKQPRKYNTSYPNKYFIFEKLQYIGSDREIQKAKIDFFNELVNNKYINDVDKKAAIDLFNDIPSKNKVIWKGTKEELYYLIKSLVKNKIIKETVGQSTTLISRVFCNSIGEEYQPKEFQALHKPASVNKIDQIVAILKPASSK